MCWQGCGVYLRNRTAYGEIITGVTMISPCSVWANTRFAPTSLVIIDFDAHPGESRVRPPEDAACIAFAY